MKLKFVTPILGALGIATALSIANVAVAGTSSEVIPEGTALDASDASDAAVLPIDLSVDANQDGISDQVLAEIQRTNAIHEALNARYQASSENGEFNEAVYEEYSAANLEANMQLEARMPFPEDARQTLNQFHKVGAQYDERIREFGEDDPEALVLLTELRQLSEQLDQNAGFVEVVEAMQKVYAFLSEE